jgi:hypothetical protein
MVETKTLEEVKLVLRRIMKIRRLGKFPNTALSIELDFEAAPKVKVLSATLVMNRALTYKALPWAS